MKYISIFKVSKIQFGVHVKVLWMDNGTEYINKEFTGLTLSQGIVHQTTYPNTPAQISVAEYKNRYLLEVICSLILMMNVPKLL
jgi:hypothetical protein